jgi:hypothetical protein
MHWTTHKTTPNEFYRVAFRWKATRLIDELLADPGARITEHKETQPNQGRRRFGKTPTQTLLDAMQYNGEK